MVTAPPATFSAADAGLAPAVHHRFLQKPEAPEIGLVAVGFSGGQPKDGVDRGPERLLSAGLLDQLRSELGHTVHYDEKIHLYENLIRSKSDDPNYRGMRLPRTVSTVCETVHKQVYEHASQGRLAFTLGGDHSIAMGTVSATARAVRERHNGQEIALLWVDAHSDINTPESSDSGNIHGMPVAFLTGIAQASGIAAKKAAGSAAAAEQDPAIFDWIKDEHMVNVRKIVYIGLRSVDRSERQILRAHKIKAFSMHDVDRYGIGRVVDMALAHIGADTPIHLSFDVDAIDPAWAPSTGTPVRGGLTLREGDYIAESVAMTGNMVGFDLVEVNPALETEAAVQDTIGAGISIVRCALGDTLL